MARPVEPLICVPSLGWNGQLLLFAPGYVNPDDPLGFQLPELDGVPLPLVVQSVRRGPWS